jgi:predicted XRE-type DNA-binding protein
MGKSGNNSSGDEGFWLKTWNNHNYEKDTKTSGNVRIDRMFINILGGIQPQKVKKLASEHTDSGFIDRFLMVPFEEKEFVFKLQAPKTTFQEDYNVFCDEFFKSFQMIPYDDNRHIMNISGDSVKAYEEKYNDILKLKYKHPNPNMRSYISKILSYFPRILVVLEMITTVANYENIPFNVSVNSIHNTHKLLLYFIKNAERVMFDIDNDNDMESIARTAKKQTKTARAEAILLASLNNEIDVTQSDIAKFVGIPQSRVSNILSKIKKTTKK